MANAPHEFEKKAEEHPRFFQAGGNSTYPQSGPSQWYKRPVTDLSEESSTLFGTPAVKANIDCATDYAKAYHVGDIDKVLPLLADRCQFGTFFGFVWGPTAVRIALMEEKKMKMHFVGKILTFDDIATDSNSASVANSNTNKNNQGLLSWLGKTKSRSIQEAWFAPSDAGLHRGPGAPAFTRVTENMFERDGYAKRTHRTFPMNMIDYFITLRVRETLVIEEGKVQIRVLQNLTQWMPLPYEYM